MKDEIKAVALFSGGLDSILAVKLIQEQGIEVKGVNFKTPFFATGGFKKSQIWLRKEYESLYRLSCPYV
jgi:tRNA U34 2-thiouridine synthase MnmA/TrmU